MTVLVLDGRTNDEDSLQFRPPARLGQFQREARAEIGDINPIRLITRQMKIFSNAGIKDRVFGNVLKGARRWIGPISCVEAYLMEMHGARLNEPLFGHYSEFGAYAVRMRSGQRRIYFQSYPESAMLPTSQKIHAGLRRDVAAGGKLEFHLHNHPFSPKNPSGDIAGTPLPSGGSFNGGDFSAFRMMEAEFGLQQARITNGFHTLRIQAQELPLLLR